MALVLGYNFFSFLDPSSGSITHNESVVLDFEETRLYVLNISAMDAGSPSNIAYVRVNISITVSLILRSTYT